MSLVLSRRPNESILIGESIRVTVTETKSGKARIAIEAPADVRILRAELAAKENAA